jgi:hypothetical protein
MSPGLRLIIWSNDATVSFGAVPPWEADTNEDQRRRQRGGVAGGYSMFYPG